MWGISVGSSVAMVGIVFYPLAIPPTLTPTNLPTPPKGDKILTAGMIDILYSFEDDSGAKHWGIIDLKRVGAKVSKSDGLTMTGQTLKLSLSHSLPTIPTEGP